MGRSKFPGKPSKHVNRTRVNVLTASTSTTVAYQAASSDPNTETKQDDILEEEVSNSNATTLHKNPRKKDVSKILTERNCKQVLSGNNRINRKKVVGIRKKPVRSGQNLTDIRKLNRSRRSQTESGKLVGKFVLPSRSVHSSRVIKPNKRFINIEPLTSIETRTFKKRTTTKRVVKVSDNGSKPCKPKLSAKLQNDAEISKNTSPSPRTPCSNRRVILRQARLQLHTHTPTGPEGPFSSSSTSSVSPPGTVTCGVCGAVRFYRFVKQARKFNIYSCESCRKFISKMIKRQTCNKNVAMPTLACHKGQGTCHVPPIVRSQQWKLIRCAYKARCPACWLKMCLRSFQMPDPLKTSLTRLLPENMQGSDALFSNSVSLFAWQGPKTIKNDAVIVSEQTAPLNSDLNSVAIRQRPIRIKILKKDDKRIIAQGGSDIKRPRIDLKGPRVKHVCRSASLVLGQPLATFPGDSSRKDEVFAEISSKNVEARFGSANLAGTNAELEICDEKMEMMKTQPLKIDLPVASFPMRERKSKQLSVPIAAPVELKPQPYGKKNLPELLNSISIDFWESYDPEEICCSGFGLMGSESLPMQAICFLCGSAGCEPLLHCYLCCEPYHSFCLEQEPRLYNESGQSYNWLCPRCTTCSACGQPDKQKVNCQKCHKAYHPECFNIKWQTDDRPTVCSSCLRCNSCGTDNITKFVGNLPLCLNCFKLRQKGNFCPLCQCCYDDNDFNTKMMECGKCHKWVHARCEEITDEQYQILSFLPQSIEFVCCICSKGSTPQWRKAVDSDLQASFNSVLRLLSKNRTARNMLKWSPVSGKAPTSTTTVSIARKLHFVDDYEPVLSDTNILTDLDKNIAQKKCNPITTMKNSGWDVENSNTPMQIEAKAKPHTPLSLVEIKNKLNAKEYLSITDFNLRMQEVVDSTQSEELSKIYHTILKNVFPWYDPTVTEENFNNTPCNSTISEENPDNTTSQSISKTPEKAAKIDARVCALCKSTGDGLCQREGRLLYCGHNEWVHANCVLWSSEVYEEIDGSLQNVHSAISRGRFIRCGYCKQKGASVGCCAKGCNETYHFPCAHSMPCHFMHDKTLYCPSHELGSCIYITSPSDFHLRRSVYVELDKKKKKFVEPAKAQFMVGSLSVTSLGKIVPRLSDNVEAIIPSGYVCSRLYWSTIEPWKLVPYNITTSVRSAAVNNILVDKNFTVDHSLSKSVVERKLRDILLWQKDAEKENKAECVDYEDEEEPQNTADILSPELTDAILEELPHEFLDGISMQDIFPKLMSNEELLNIDFKTTEYSHAMDMAKQETKKLLDSDEEKDSTDLELAVRSIQEQLGDIPKPQNRSCSVTLSCKLDTSLSPPVKKRKVIPRNNIFFQVVQVDGACDSSSGSECGSPAHETEDLWSPQLTDAPVKCQRCQCTYRTQASYTRHLETCEVMSTSESDSEITQERDYTEHADTEIVEPFVLAAKEPYNNDMSIALNEQTFVSGEASTEICSVPGNNNLYYSTVMEPKPAPSVYVPQPINHVTTILPETTPMTVPVESRHTFTTTNPSASFCLNTPQSLYINQPGSGISVVHSPAPVTVNDLHSTPITLQPISHEVSPQQITLSGSLLTIPQTQWIKPPTIMAQKSIRPRARPRSLAAKRTRLPGSMILQPNNPVIMQQVVAPGSVPAFIEAFQQQTGQNLQYLATITPSAVTQQQPILQLHSDNGLVSLVSGVQPTMIVQQPRMITDQLIVDSNGSMVWATQPVQPVIYGFETIVQNTVMQSQQFLPTTMPGILTTNSSYSSTTQVFQTSKLEPLLDVSSGSFVLLNSGSLVNPSPVQANMSSAPPVVPEKATPWRYVEPTLADDSPPPKPVSAVVSPTNSHSITLPIAPFVPEPGIPTNIVTPTPKVPLSTQSRPMSRVLPMQTNSGKPVKKNFVKTVEKPLLLKQSTKSALLEERILNPGVVKSNKLQILNEVIIKPARRPECKKLDIEKPADACKLVLEKQSEEGVYRINNSFLEKGTPSIQVASLKPLKAKPSSIDNHVGPKVVVEKIEEMPVRSASPKVTPKPEPVKKELEKQETGNVPAIIYTVENQDGFRYSSTSISELWGKVFEAVQAARAAHNMEPLPANALNMTNNLQVLGLKSNGLKYLLEQLPGANSDDESIFGNSFEAIRCAPVGKNLESSDMFGWLASKHRKPTMNVNDNELSSRRNSITNLPMAMRFRQLRLTSKESVGVYHSTIHKRGLFCLRDIESGEMVIEYAGEVIRSILADKREKEYNAKGIGCYMFRIDDNLVVDATMKGNAARFINHSCDPNCYSKVVEVLGHKHIVIFALRKIVCAEELTYDYKFPFEEDKIPCTCGSRRCRKFLN